jgi:hypothetical protein
MATCDLGAPGVASLPFLRVEAAEAVRRGPAIRLSARRSPIMELKLAEVAIEGLSPMRITSFTS